MMSSLRNKCPCIAHETKVATFSILGSRKAPTTGQTGKRVGVEFLQGHEVRNYQKVPGFGPWQCFLSKESLNQLDKPILSLRICCVSSRRRGKWEG